MEILHPYPRREKINLAAMSLKEVLFYRVPPWPQAQTV